MYSIILIIVNLIFRVCAAGIVANPLILPPIILDPDLTLDGAPKREGFTVVTKAWLKKVIIIIIIKKKQEQLLL